MRKRKAQITDNVVYIPDIDNNRTDEDPFTVTIKPLSAGQYDDLRRQQSSGSVRKRGGVGTVASVLGLATDTRNAVVTECVVSVSGYAIELADGSTVTPTDGKGLVETITEYGDAHEDTILDDIFAAVTEQATLREGVAKNS